MEQNRRGIAWVGIAAMGLAALGLSGKSHGAPVKAAPSVRSAWERVTVTIDRGPGRRGKPQKPVEIACSLPQRCKYVRGVIVAGSFGDVGPVREAAARASLGIVQGSVHAPSGKDTLENIDAVLEKWAEASGHPELRGAAILTASISAGVIWARNVAYAAPERVMGVVHIAGGNMHQHMVDERKTLAGVPFIAMNGELESCGPEGGIRPHLGYDTQWYLQAEQMLKRRRDDPNNLMSLVVIPCRGHTAWNHELGALFVRKCAQYRLPKEKRDGSTPAKCVPLKVEDGWLSDPNVRLPRHRSAEWSKYGGDKTNAFWHLDRQMAQAVEKYHRNGIRPGQGRSLFRPRGLFDDLWPLGQRMDIPFKGNTPEAREAAIREWILSKTDRKNHPIGTRDLIERDDGGWSYANWVHPAALPHLVKGVVAGIQKGTAAGDEGVSEAACRRACLRVLYAYEDVYRPIEDVIDKAGMPEAFKDRLRDIYAERLLRLWPWGEFTPSLSVRETQTMIAGWRWQTPMAKLATREKLAAAMDTEAARVRAATEKAYGAPPAELAGLIGALAQKDAKSGWAAVDKLAALGRPAIPVLVRTMEWAPQPAAMRAAGTLGRMGAAAEPALPDLKRLGATGSRDTERNSEICVKALEAADLIKKAMSEASATGEAEGPSPSLRLVAASFFGTAEDDDIQGVCGGPGGTIYIAGNAGARMNALPGGAKPARIGSDAENARCGHGFVAQLSADGRRLMKYAEFGKGILSCTTVQANDNGVYVAGYATDALEALLKDVPGLMKEYPLRKEVALLESGKWPDAVGEAKDTIPEKKHGQLGRYGAPFILRLSADLAKIESGTYLEGWQQVWAKYRSTTDRPKGARNRGGWPVEYNWLPILVRLLKSGDPVVCHDGGYYRLLTDEDRKFAAENAERLVNENPTSHPPTPWRGTRSTSEPLPDRETRIDAYRRATLKRLGFYDVCDHLSRLSPDLDKRVWHTPIYTPATNPKAANKVRFGWRAPHHSNPRTHRMQLDEDENIFLCGWSATCTSCEPWWSFYIWRMSSQTGELIWKVAEKDPMAGGRHRMFGSVADRGIGALAVRGDRFYHSSYSDGGWDGALHFSGSVCAQDKATFDQQARVRTGPSQWTLDLHAFPGEAVVASGRGEGLRNTTPDAWQEDSPLGSPMAWLSLHHGPKLDRRFHTVVQGLWPYAMEPVSGNRFVWVGASWGTIHRKVLGEGGKTVIREEPNPGLAVVKNAMFGKQNGKKDGYFALIQYEECARAEGGR